MNPVTSSVINEDDLGGERLCLLIEVVTDFDEPTDEQFFTVLGKRSKSMEQPFSNGGGGAGARGQG